MALATNAACDFLALVHLPGSLRLIEDVVRAIATSRARQPTRAQFCLLAARRALSELR